MAEESKAPSKTFAAKFTSRSGTCAIPLTHDKLWEIHHWWHEMARGYHEPDPFRWALGTFIQAARGVTFMLQKEKAAFKDFTWYDEWVAKAKDDPLLRWIKESRTDVVHRAALEPDSWLEMACVGRVRDPEDEDDHPVRFRANPFQCTHEHIWAGPNTDHTYEFTRFWTIEGVEKQELLGVGATIFEQYDKLVVEAHGRIGYGMGNNDGAAGGIPSCMKEIMKHRVVRTVLRDGVEGVEKKSPGPHE